MCHGECHLVVGPNGAGKTTLLRILAGLARPTSGRVVGSGGRPAGDPAHRGSVGLLSHQTFLYDDLTPLENLSLTARLYGLNDPDGRARAGLDRLGLLPRISDPIRRLSRGMVQRVAIARALLPEPQLLLLDEPFIGLDPEAVERVLTLLRAHLEAQRGVILVSHDLHEAWQLATHAHVMIRGEWRMSERASGDIDGFLARYRELLRG